jgi:hypothetical protein
VKHAGAEAIRELEPMLADLRTLGGLIEKKPGVFYRRGKAFLHFHEDPEGLFADVRFADAGDFERLRVTTTAERKRFVALVRIALR